ncbi:MAG TPA: type II toxin-antitoxin system VapC family toxin [Terriglobales bacterium]|nr:type II toxin-antitoxin system VapC family toxin [Terriglobales bacterium]
MTYLLDTDLCLAVMRRRAPELRERFARLVRGEAAISVVTYGELRYGANKSRQPEQAAASLAEFVSLVPVAALDASAGAEYGRIRAVLEARGQIIGNNDLWIAAHAAALQLVLVTYNQREFSRVPGLKVEDWTPAERRG